MKVYEFYNIRNDRKRLWVKQYDDGHYYVVQWLPTNEGTLSFMGQIKNRHTFRKWKKQQLMVLLEDYVQVTQPLNVCAFQRSKFAHLRWSKEAREKHERFEQKVLIHFCGELFK